MNTRINLSDVWLRTLLSILIGNNYEVKVDADNDCLNAEILGAFRMKPSYSTTQWLLVTIDHDGISFEWGSCNGYKMPSWEEMAGFFTGMLRACASSLEFDRSKKDEGEDKECNYVRFSLSL